MKDQGIEGAASFLLDLLSLYENLLNLSEQQKKVIEVDESAPVLNEILYQKECLINSIKGNDSRIKVVQEANLIRKDKVVSELIERLRHIIKNIVEIEGTCKDIIEKCREDVKDEIQNMRTGKKIIKGYDQSSLDNKGFICIKG